MNFFLTITCLFFLSYECIGQIQTNKAYIDSLTWEVYKYSISDPERAQSILETIKKQKRDDDTALHSLEADFYLNNSKYRLAILHYKKSLEADSTITFAAGYMLNLSRLIDCCITVQETEEAMTYTQQLMSLAGKENDLGMKASALFSLGSILYMQNDKSRGFRYMQQAVDSMKQSDYKYKFDEVCYYYKKIILFQQKDSLYEASLQTIRLLQKEIDDVDETETWLIDNFKNDIQTSIYAYLVKSLYSLGQVRQADSCYQRWKEQKRQPTGELILVGDYLIKKGYYDEAIRLCQEEKERLEEDEKVNYSNYLLSLNLLLAEAYRKQYNYPEAVDKYIECLAIQDSIKEHEQKSEALEYASIYQFQEMDFKIQEQKAILQNHNSLFVEALIIFIMILSLLFGLTRYAKKINNKNRAMVDHIRRIQLYKELFDQYFRSKGLSDPDNMEASNSAENQNCSLYIKLYQLMNEQKLYHNANLTREELASILGTNRNKLTAIIQEYTGLGFTDYINTFRLEEALLLLRNSREGDSIDQIAESVGFSKSSFYRLFKQKYDMTPSKYRNLTQMQSIENIPVDQ